MTANGRLVCQPEETGFDWCALLQMCFGLRSFSIRLSPVTACLTHSFTLALGQICMSLMCLARLEFSLFLYFYSALSTQHRGEQGVPSQRLTVFVRKSGSYKGCTNVHDSQDDDQRRGFSCETLFMYILRAQRGP